MMRRLSLLIVVMGVASCMAFASDEGYSRIARISYLEGHVSFQHPNEVDWSAASINMALQPADRIYTGDDGRAEVEFDDGSVLRLAERTDLEVLSLRDDLIQLRVLVGLCSLTAHGGVGFEVDTPAAAYNTLEKGVYRFDVTENGDTDAIVRKGLLEAANNKYSQRIDSGELAHVTPGGQGAVLVSRYGPRDAWDEWTDRRDADVTAYESRRYLPDNVTMGVSELDQYGHWVVVDSYGPAWVPLNVAAGWSPYWEGRWCYRPFWGWTWVSYEPWGWLPYHYGRWYYSGFGWCWLPGPSFGFNFWSPGLVRFYYGPSWVSWCPLGPGDYYNVNHYWYNRAYYNQVNNIRLVQNRAPGDLFNRNVPGAFRTVPTSTFASSALGGTDRLVRNEMIDQPWRQGRMITDRLPVQPSQSSYAPVPGRPAVRPAIEPSLPTLVRTMPSVEGSGANRLVRITNPAVTAPSAAGSGTEGRTMVGVGPRAGSNAAGGNQGSSIWNRQATGQSGGNATNGRVNQIPAPPASNGSASPSNNRESPGNSGRRIENRPGSTQVAPPARPRTDTASPGRIQSAPANRGSERPAPQPRQQEQSRPSRPRASVSEPGSTWQYVSGNNTTSASGDRTPQVELKSESGSPMQRVQSGVTGATSQVYSGSRPSAQQSYSNAPQTERRYELPAPRPAAPPSFGGGNRTIYSAPAGRSYSPGTWGGTPGGVRSMPSQSAPGGGAGIARPRGR